MRYSAEERWRRKSEKRIEAMKEAQATADRLERDYECRHLFSETYCGGYSGEDPPLPIPNREVKLTIADGTAPPGGRVGSCHFYIRDPDVKSIRVFSYAAARTVCAA